RGEHVLQVSLGSGSAFAGVEDLAPLTVRVIGERTAERAGDGLQRGMVERCEARAHALALEGELVLDPLGHTLGEPRLKALTYLRRVLTRDQPEGKLG